MDDVDRLPADQPRERIGVQHHAGRVLRGGRERQPFAALRLQLAHEAAALRRHQRAGAERGQRLGDVDRRAFRPAGLELGDELEDGAAVQDVTGVRGKG